jgi:NADPH:quinone reductase-like Zn-dependent oxidoreductase
VRLLLLLMSIFIASGPTTAADCGDAPIVREATLTSIQAFTRAQKMSVLTFAGFSGAQYQQPDLVLRHAARILEAQDQKSVLVNAGATAVGIGAIYELAKHKGFTTMGIVSSLAREEGAALSPCVDYVFFVEDESWGGLIPGTDRLSPVSEAIVGISTALVAIGGGDTARDELIAARSAGKKVTFIPADMNHAIARARARKRGESEPTDFRGSAHIALRGAD